MPNNSHILRWVLGDVVPLRLFLAFYFGATYYGNIPIDNAFQISYLLSKFEGPVARQLQNFTARSSYLGTNILTQCAAQELSSARDSFARLLEKESAVLQGEDKLHLTAVFGKTPVSLIARLSQGKFSTSIKNGFGECIRETVAELTPVFIGAGSELSRIINAETGKKIVLSKHMKNVLSVAWKACITSEGVYNPSNVINDGTIFGILEENWDFDAKAGTITKKHSNALIFIGNIAAGYFVDAVADRIEERYPGESCVVCAGSHCRASASTSSGYAWNAHIPRGPLTDSDVLLDVPLDGEALSVVSAAQYQVRHDANSNENSFSSFLFSKEKLLLDANQNIDLVAVRGKRSVWTAGTALAALLTARRGTHSLRAFLDSAAHHHGGLSSWYALHADNSSLLTADEMPNFQSPFFSSLRRRSIAEPARVAVIGGGLAGLSAAHEAVLAGADVILIDKNKNFGGNSAKATSGINAVGTVHQAQRSIQDSHELFEKDTLKSGYGGKSDINLIKMLSLRSADAVNAIEQACKAQLNVVAQLGGHSIPRTHRFPDSPSGRPTPVGFTITKLLEDAIRVAKAGKLTILSNTTAEEILTVHEKAEANDEEVSNLIAETAPRVTGVRVRSTVPAENGSMSESENIYADAIVLATGGFSNDHTENSLISEFAPHMINYPTTNGPFATGDGIKMSRKLNPLLIDMDKLQLHPTGLINPKDPAGKTKFLGPEALRGAGGVLISRRGERFVNELDLRSVVSKAIINQGDVYPGSAGAYYAYIILNEAALELFGAASMGFYEKMGLFTHVPTLNKLCDSIGCSCEKLASTLTAYEKLSHSGMKDNMTGKTVYPCVVGPQGPFWVGVVTPAIHYSMGGMLISPMAELYTSSPVFHCPKNNGTLPDFLLRQPIRGLFAAGEVTAGVHGANRLGGNSLLECAVFGRIAGDRAATIKQRNTNGLSNEEWRPVVLSEIHGTAESNGAACNNNELCKNALESKGAISSYYGKGVRVIGFSTSGSDQLTGVKLGQLLAIRGSWDGKLLVRYLVPIITPLRRGIVFAIDNEETVRETQMTTNFENLKEAEKHIAADWASNYRISKAFEAQLTDGFKDLSFSSSSTGTLLTYKGAQVRRCAMVALGSRGVTPMLQILELMRAKSLNTPQNDYEHRTCFTILCSTLGSTGVSVVAHDYLVDLSASGFLPLHYEITNEEAIDTAIKLISFEPQRKFDLFLMAGPSKAVKDATAVMINNGVPLNQIQVIITDF